jgi:DNA-binding NarL/FixJ family response regulator
MILGHQADIEVIGEAASAEDGLRLARALKPDVVLMDLQLPGVSGLEATERIVRGDWGPRVIVLTARAESPFPRRLLEAGASGFLTKAGPAEELVQAVRAVAMGERFLGADVARALALENLPGAGGGASPFAQLSAREIEVAMMLARGEGLGDIARRLNLSAKTVSTYKYRLYDKLGIDNEVALAHLAMQHGVIGPGAT